LDRTAFTDQRVSSKGTPGGCEGERLRHATKKQNDWEECLSEMKIIPISGIIEKGSRTPHGGKAATTPGRDRRQGNKGCGSRPEKT